MAIMEWSSDVCSSDLPGKLVDHHIRRGSFERSTYCLSVESIGDGRRSTEFTQQFDTRSATYHASNLVTQGAKGAHQRKAHRTDGASNKDFHERNSFEV